MEIHENKLLDDLKNQISSADKYKEDLNVLNGKFYSILDDFKKYYIFLTRIRRWMSISKCFQILKTILNL